MTYTNATDRDTDSDGIEDFTEAMDGFQWNGSTYFTNASRMDTDNDGLDDREEVISGEDQYVTNASDIDSDDDDLKDGFEVLNIPGHGNLQPTLLILIQTVTCNLTDGKCKSPQ